MSLSPDYLPAQSGRSAERLSRILALHHMAAHEPLGGFIGVDAVNKVECLPHIVCHLLFLLLFVEAQVSE